MAIAPVLKTGERKLLGVRVPHPPFFTLALIALAGCQTLSKAPYRAGTDSFTGNGLARFAHHSDEGDPWSTRRDTLRGDGNGIQSVLIRKDQSVFNGFVEVDASMVDDGGLVLRFLDNTHYYLLAIRDDGAPAPRNVDNLQIYRRNGTGAGGFSSLFRKNVTWPRGETHRIRFSVNGSTFTVAMDGVVLGGITEPSLDSGTGFGLRHYGRSEYWKSRYRNFRWRSVEH